MNKERKRERRTKQGMDIFSFLSSHIHYLMTTKWFGCVRLKIGKWFGRLQTLYNSRSVDF